MTKIALLGAGGKMGFRIASKIESLGEYERRYVEIAPAAIARLRSVGMEVTAQEEAVGDADIVILAVPDRLIGPVSREVVPSLKAGAMLVGLDPAAAYAGVMPVREELSYFVAHPCHPSMFALDPSSEALSDYFGGVASMDIVCALYRGPESAYLRGEQIARVIYAPVRESFRVTVEQMVILEPALVETVGLSLVGAMSEAVEEAAKMGVPEKVARSFLWGHIRTLMASVFGVADFSVSDGARQAMMEAHDVIFKPDWKERVFDLERIGETVNRITGTIAK